jgi:F-type H+-transporting ATPase subunit delta
VFFAVAASAALCYSGADFEGAPSGASQPWLVPAPVRGLARADVVEGVDVSETASLSMGIAQRYATAVFELAKEDKALPALEADIDLLESILAESAEFRRLINSPIYSREEQARAVQAVAEKIGLSKIMVNTLGLMASKRRLFVLPQLVRALRNMIAEEKGEVSAEVFSAKPLTKAQSEKLAKALKAAVGKEVRINAAVDESLIGGLVVKVGSRMVDTSIRSKLAHMQNMMKEVG